ncbi:MAG TPA: hypothetical protein VK609_15490, partial [Mucilaginibacter sp.]|nr:hypothetical protein [Mucilaginibacter sp.]
RCLDTAYVNFFRGNAKFPGFKSRKKKNTFTVPQFAKLEDGKFYAPKCTHLRYVTPHSYYLTPLKKTGKTRQKTRDCI